MGIVYLWKGDDRQAFLEMLFKRFEVDTYARGKAVLVKPNIVSSEAYPTTTHPAMLEACLGLLQGFAGKIVVADGPACDAGNSKTIIENHPLRRSCQRLGVELLDLTSKPTTKVRTRSLELELWAAVFQCDLIISLPVLKSHGICGLTGALKNQLGLLSVAEKRRLHWGRNVHRVIAEVNEIIRPGLQVVDAVQTLTNTNEIRHGGKPADLGYMLAGGDPVSLDACGLELLATVDPGLASRRPDDILHLRYASDLGVGETAYEIVEC